MPMMFFHFLKIIFDISTSKRSKRYKPHSILAKKKSKFNKIQLQTQGQTVSTCLKILDWQVSFFFRMTLIANLNKKGFASSFFVLDIITYKHSFGDSNQSNQLIRNWNQTGLKKINSVWFDDPVNPVKNSVVTYWFFISKVISF